VPSSSSDSDSGAAARRRPLAAKPELPLARTAAAARQQPHPLEWAQVIPDAAADSCFFAATVALLAGVIVSGLASSAAALSGSVGGLTASFAAQGPLFPNATSMW
jgi:hypothetical protein